MPEKLRTYTKKLIELCSKAIKNIRLPSFHHIGRFFRSWWQLILLFFAGIIFLYYPLGGLLIEDINTDTSVEITPSRPEQSTSAEMMSFIISREVSRKMWTPNLPFFFPSYFLDNMPNFQLGMMSSVSNLSRAMSKRLEKPEKDKQGGYLTEAAQLLQYPGTIWMFSPQNRLMPAPSSNSQYKKARKQLVKYCQSLNEGSEIFYRNSDDLAYFLNRMSISLGKSLEKIENQIRENSDNIIDNQADDIFYYTKGQMYADYLLLKALGADYKHIIVGNNLYLPWTKMLNALELGAQLSPTIVRNGEIDSSFAPNHLAAMALYTVKARALMREMAFALRIQLNKKDKQ